MKKHARRAFNALAVIGAPIFMRGDETDGCHFHINGESNISETWADYHRPEFGLFGVSRKITDVLDKNGLFCEWETPGGLKVYDA